jgi:uncharacterized membrane protein
MEFGPVQVVVVGFSEDGFAGGILPELRRLRGQDMIRLIDVTFVYKDDDGRLTTMDVSDVTEERGSEFGEIVEALIGLGEYSEQCLSVGAGAGAADGALGSDTGETWAISDAIPAGTSAAVALIEHRWAIPLRGAIIGSGGFALEDTWVHPADLLAVGAVMTGGVGTAG